MSLRSPTFHFPLKSSENQENKVHYSSKTIQRFSINQSNSIQNIPKIFSKRFPKLTETFLGKGYKKCVFISPQDFKPFNQSIVNLQLKILRQEEETNNFDFIFLGLQADKIISQQLITWLHPRNNKRGWQFSAVKQNNSIYVWNTCEDIVTRTPESYYLHYFRSLITEECVKSEYEKSFSLNKIQIGKYSCLLPVEIDAEEEEQEVGVRLHKEFSPIRMKRKRQNYWAEWIACGWESLVLGQRDYRGLLRDVCHLKCKEDLLQDNSGEACLKRQEDFLEWIKKILKKEGIVYSFEWSPTDWIFSDVVTCTKANAQEDTPLTCIDANNNRGDE